MPRSVFTISVSRSQSIKVSTVLSIVVLLGGLAVLAGWVFHIQVLKGIRPGLVEMKFNTAACFAAVGAASLLVRPPTGRAVFRKIGFTLTAAVVVLAGLTLCEYLFKIDLHIDELFFRDDIVDVGTTSRGRMAVVSAICFVLTGAGIVSIRFGRLGFNWPINLCTSVLLGLGIPSLVGYVYGIRRLYGIAHASEMAPHTSLLFIAIALALMTACPECGLVAILTSDRAGGFFARRILPAAVLIPVGLGAVLAIGGNFGTGDTAYAATLSAVVFLIVFIAFLWFTAVTLDRVDALRIESEREIAGRIERDIAQRKMMDHLREADRLKDQFLATMSHELRTPLTSILGWSTLLREPHAPADMFAEAIDAIHRNAVAQTRLVEDLLDTSSIVQGKLRLENKPMDLSAVVREAVRTAAQVSSDRVVNVTLKLSASPVWIVGDPYRCRQIVINLVNNAIKFGDENIPPGVTLTADQSLAVLTVVNAGQGISADFLPHVFERFRQQDSSYTRSHQGLGLGLSIVKTMIDLHGGSIEAASDGPGRGARFIARFPTIAPPIAA